MFEIKTIVNKQPFMYEIGDIVYFIGFGVFQACNDQRSFFEFNRYREILSAIGRERLFGGRLTPDEIEQLVNAFKQVRKLSNDRNAFDENANQTKKRFEEAVEKMLPIEKSQLADQLNEFICVYKVSEQR